MQMQGIKLIHSSFHPSIHPSKKNTDTLILKQRSTECETEAKETRLNEQKSAGKRYLKEEEEDVYNLRVGEKKRDLLGLDGTARVQVLIREQTSNSFSQQRPIKTFLPEERL